MTSVSIIEMPEYSGEAAFALVIAAGVAIKNVNTTPLFSPEDGIAAMKKTATSGYKPIK